MAMTKEEVFGAFRFYASKEFEHIPHNDSEIDFEFSEDFEKKMEKLLKKVRYDSTHVVSWSIKKAVLIAATIILAIAGMMSVSAIREPVVEFFTEIYEGFIEIIFEGDTTNTITYKYSFSEIPEGFVETQSFSNESVHMLRYENTKNNQSIDFVQSVTENYDITVDNEHGHTDVIDISGIKVTIYTNDTGTSCHVFWIKDSYYLTLSFSWTISSDELIDIINHIN